MTPLQEQIALVARLRAVTGVSDQQVEQLRAEFERQHAVQIAQLRQYRVDLALAEGKLRELAVAAFRETGERRPASGVAVKMRMRLEYQPEAAIEWAIEHHRASLLTLHRSEFERLAKALDDAGPPDALWFVRHIPEPAATIATDLSAFATEAPAEALEVPF